MDEGGGHGDPVDPFHCDEVIPAVADANFLAEEDEDYEDLYGDISSGEGSNQPVHNNDDLEVNNNEVEDKKNLPPPTPPPPVQNAGGDGVSLPGDQGGGIRVELGKKSATLSGIEEQSGNAGVGIGNEGNTLLLVSDLEYWTTDTDLEDEVCKYGKVKELSILDYKDNGKSTGFCQVEFHDSLAAIACKERMNGHRFNGKPCVVSFTTPSIVEKMREDHWKDSSLPVNQTDVANQGRRGPAEVGADNSGGGNVGTSGNYGGNVGIRGPVNQIWNRGGGMGGRGIMGNAGIRYGQGIGAALPMRHPQSLMNQGFGRSFGSPMPRMGGYASFPGGRAPIFSGNLPSYPGFGLLGDAPNVNPNYFGRGRPLNALEMVLPSGMGGSNMGMSPGSNIGGSGGDDFGGGKVAEPDHGEVNLDRAGLPISMREKDRGSERDGSRTSERKLKDDRNHEYERDVPREKDVRRDHEERRNRGDREMGRERYHDRDRERGRDRDRERERDRHREDRDKHMDHRRYKDHEEQHNDESERGQSSRTHRKSRFSTDEKLHHSKKDSDYRKS